MDRVSRLVRSRIMSKIKGKWTKPESFVHSFLLRRFVEHVMHPDLFGKPDVCVGNMILFIDGCFWHRCPKHYRVPKTNVRFWKHKIRQNVNRRIHVIKGLNKMGYVVVRIWECSLNEKSLESFIDGMRKVSIEKLR